MPYATFADVIAADSDNDEVIVMEQDPASLASVRWFAATFERSEPKLDVLVNNGCVKPTCRHVTGDSNKLQMQTNHFGHFLLTNSLLGAVGLEIS